MLSILLSCDIISAEMEIGRYYFMAKCRGLKEAIEKIPFGDIKKLQGIDNGYRLRVGDLRVLFSIEDDRIYIDNIIPRGQAYKRL